MLECVQAVIMDIDMLPLIQAVNKSVAAQFDVFRDMVLTHGLLAVPILGTETATYPLTQADGSLSKYACAAVNSPLCGHRGPSSVANPPR